MIKKIIKNFTKKFGYTIEKITHLDPTIDMDEEFTEMWNRLKPMSMAMKPRAYGLYKAVKHIIKADIKGDFVECGVYKGVNTMIIAETLLKLGVTNRKIYLYDTFTGMSEPTKEDFLVSEETVTGQKVYDGKKGRGEGWCVGTIEEVMENMKSTGYPMQNIIFVKGKVEDTIPLVISKEIALLRLDTDFYTSTKHELEQLYPILVPNGVLIVDDYGDWAGSKKAVDDYFKDIPIPLIRLDSQSILGIKLGGKK